MFSMFRLPKLTVTMRIPVMAPTKLKLRATAKNTMKIAETMVDVVLSLFLSLTEFLIINRDKCM